MDLIDEIIADWTTQRPDINCRGKAVVLRILRSFSHYVSIFEKSLKPLGITPTIFSILVTIRRKGPNAQVTVKQIMEEALVTSGATSNLINKLIESELVTKRKGSQNEDARSAFIMLSAKGIAIIDKAMEVQAACERKLTQNLNQSERKLLSELLRKMQQED